MAAFTNMRSQLDSSDRSHQPTPTREIIISIEVKTLGDIAGKFDISDSEAERIAGASETEEELETMWENEGWWADDNSA